MAKDNSAGGGNGGGAVTSSCCVEKCTGKTEKMNFCKDHFVWFKEGLVNKKGQRPTDFDKKYQAYMMRANGKKAA